MTTDGDPTVRTGILAGLTVLDAGSVISAPMAATIMADHGARVIKVERPVIGDNARVLGQNGSWWRFLGRNKDCITCDLGKPEGAELFIRLAEKSDVVIENFRPGTFERWGLSYAILSAKNPGLVMLRITGWGKDGPYASRPGYGTLAAAVGGVQYLTGDQSGPPTLVGGPIEDSMAAMAGVTAVMMALWAREHGDRSGRGAEIDLSLYSPIHFMEGANLTEASDFGVSPERNGNQMPQIPGYERKGGTLRDSVLCRDDKWVSYSILAPNLVRKVAELLAEAGWDPREWTLPDGKLIAGVPFDKGALNTRFREWIRARDRADVVRELVAFGIPIAPVYSMTDILEDEHFNTRNEFATVPGSERSDIRVPRGPLRFNGQQAVIRHGARDLGADNEAVYREMLGLSKDDLAKLARIGAV